MRGRKIAIEFRSKEDADKAIDLFWTDTELYGLPRDYTDFKTYIIPDDWQERVRRRLKMYGLSFRMATVT